MFTWIKNRRRRKLLAQPIPAAWQAHLRQNVQHYLELTDEERARLRDDLRVFIAEKYWEGCNGLELTDEMKVTIAAQACLLTLHIKHDYYRRVKTILVYPDAFVVPRRTAGLNGIVSEGGVNSGEAWFRGPVILAWDDVLAGGRHMADGRNLVLHEFAHALDMMDGLVDGTPPLKTKKDVEEWRAVMTQEYRRLIEYSQEGRPTLLRSYGATNVAEFFAVATECFFEQGRLMQEHHPRLYQVLRDYYGQNPASRGR
jgi:MtfA peptidase